MVDFGSIYPDEEEIKLAFDRSMSVINEELQNLRDILKRLMNGNCYIDSEQCAQVFHCKISEIPVGLPKYRANKPLGGNGYLYKLSEIMNFIEERRIPKKQN